MNIKSMLTRWAQSNGNPPHWIVEKDYAISYLLFGMMKVEELYNGLLLKGGTALKKVYFPNYRFSEDLDFSIRPEKRVENIDKYIDLAVEKSTNLLQEKGAFHVEWSRMRSRDPHPGGQSEYLCNQECMDSERT